MQGLYISLCLEMAGGSMSGCGVSSLLSTYEFQWLVYSSYLGYASFTNLILRNLVIYDIFQPDNICSKNAHCTGGGEEC